MSSAERPGRIGEFDGGGGGGELFVGGGEEEGGRAWWEDKSGAAEFEGEALRGVGRGGALESDLGSRSRWRFGGREGVGLEVDLEVGSLSQGRVRAMTAGYRGWMFENHGERNSKVPIANRGMERHNVAVHYASVT